MHTHTKGFTLIEVMVVVAIVATLSAIAFNSYKEHTDRSKRIEGRSYLLELASMQQRFFTQNVSYANTLTKTGLELENNNSPDKRYTIKLDTKPADCAPGKKNCTYYSLTATAVQSDPKCLTLTYDSRGEKGSTGSASVEECWR